MDGRERGQDSRFGYSGLALDAGWWKRLRVYGEGNRMGCCEVKQDGVVLVKGCHR